jgi:RNA polymerase sigma factor (sigma-70 family)
MRMAGPPLTYTGCRLTLGDMDLATGDIALTDEQLAQTVARRQHPQGSWPAARQACEQLYVRHARRLLSFLAARVSRNDLEDTHQAIWQKVWHRLPGGFHGGNFRAWLYQIARNHLIDLKRKKTVPLAENKVLEAKGRESEAEILMAEQEENAILQRCLGRLSDEAASIVRARLAGESYREFCQRTGWKLDRAQKLFLQAKHQLQVCVERAEA